MFNFKRNFDYHVVYSFKGERGSGDGSITISRNKKIRTAQDLQGIKEYIEKEFKLGSVIILNWIILK